MTPSVAPKATVPLVKVTPTLLVLSRPPLPTVSVKPPRLMARPPAVMFSELIDVFWVSVTLPVTWTFSVPLPPVAGRAWVVGEIVNVQGAAGWVTVKVLPAIVIVPVRDAVAVFAATL